MTGSTPWLVWKNDCWIEMTTGIPATTAMTSKVGARRIQASRPCPSLKAFFLCFWPPSATGVMLRGSAVAVAMR